MIKVKRAFLSSLVSFALFSASAIYAGVSLSAPGRIELPKKAVFKKVLENGLTLLTERTSPQGLVSIDINIKAGTSAEDEYSGSGISHFVEHMLFKGTLSRKAGDIEKEVKSYGGFINGATSQDLVSLHVTVPSEYLDKTLSLLKDMLSNATFEESEFEKEREVILKEIRLNKDEPKDELARLLYETAYINHPYKYPVIGYEDKLKALKREDLIRYYNKRYVPNRMVVALVGGADMESTISTIENEFKDFRPPDYKIDAKVQEPLQIARRELEKSSSINLSYLAMGYHSTSVLDKDLFAMDVLSMILGRGDDSRLKRVLLKEKRLVHSIASWNYTPKDPGMFVVSAILDRANLDSAQESILHEIKRLSDEPIEDEELESSKRMVLSDYIFSHETVEGRSGDICANEALTGNYDFSPRYVDGIQAVSKEDLKRVIDRYLVEDNLTVIRLVPTSPERTHSKEVSISVAKEILKKETIPNGLVVILREDAKTPTVSITIALSGGVFVEAVTDNGISNLTARMLLKGTHAKRERDIAAALERRGGRIEPFSGLNGFGLNLALLKGDLDFALSLLKDILTDSVFPEDALDRERSITLAMIKEEDDDIFERGVHLLRVDLFKGHPYGLRDIGEAQSIRSLKRQDLLNFYNRYCVPNNMIISISGDIESESLMREIKDAFKDIERKALPQASVKEARLDVVKRRTLKMDRSESLILMGFKTTSAKDPDRYALDLLSSILSGYSGRLFTSLRDKVPLAYALGCGQRFAVDTGYLVLYVATTKDKIQETKKALTDEVEAITSRLVEDEELTLAKRELRSGHRIKMQTNEFRSFQMALDELYGLGYDNVYKYEEMIDKVTKEDIRRVANKYLDLTRHIEVVISSK